MSTPQRTVLTQGMTRPAIFAAAASIMLVAVSLDQVVPGGPERPARGFLADLRCDRAHRSAVPRLCVWAERSPDVGQAPPWLPGRLPGPRGPLRRRHRPVARRVEHAYWAQPAAGRRGRRDRSTGLTALPVPAIASAPCSSAQRSTTPWLPGTSGSLVFICLFFFLISVFISSSLTVVRGYARYAVEERRDLRAEVSRLSAQLARAAEGDLAVSPLRGRQPARGARRAQ